ncbi:protein phosphatase 2C domain-containing protein [Argonema galeatum]|uniref:protein phosphatase 2C domain-containing protein n=1 Tax=Argonema galeatum TaxID=2942762 RepID=UPI00201287B2|nr:protein phosphatase 2C domain-containing protein [Argonema galeatum]MCL1466631.1 protein phosphatase 2C domain-containing protein [Argonema galeatum A003/A1]
MQNHNQNDIACFTMPKIGEQEADIQDACDWSDDKSLVAIADGASTSLFPGEWAKLLVKHFCDYNQDSIESIYQQWEQWLKPIQEEWRKFWFAEIQKKNAPWNVKAIRKENYASATCIGLKFRPLSETGEKTWEAIAVGDSCLFQIKARENNFIAFPINKSESFQTVTDCFHSLPEQKSSSPKYNRGFYEEGDIFLLATDALAEWIFKDLESGSDKRTNLISISTPDEFKNFIEQLRGDNLIKNDDTTICRIKIATIPQKQVSSQPLLPPSNQENSDSSEITNTDVGVETMQSTSQSSSGRPVTPQERLNKRIFIGIQIAVLVGIINLLVNIFFPLIAHFSKNPDPSTTKPQPSPVASSKAPASNNSNTATTSAVPIYAAEANSSNQPIQAIGYLLRKPSGSESLQLLVLTPLSYINEQEKKLTIPAKSQPLPIFLYKPQLKELLPEDFLGYLLPGNSLPLDKAIKSSTFKEAQWVKIQVRLAK